jgi:hypothetical protein
MYVYSKKEGCYEGVGTMIVGLHALMRRAYVSDDMTGGEFFAVALCLFSSLVSQIPNAALAQDILYAEATGDVRVDDFYEVEEQKKISMTRKYLPSLDCLSFSVALAITFQSNGMILQLWYFGIGVGLVWWIFYFQICCQRAFPSCRGAMGWICIFVFWFMSPTRIGGYPHLQEALYAGNSDLHSLILRGMASLDPGHYYFIRVTTLSLFWIWAFLTHDGFFNIVLQSFNFKKNSFVSAVMSRHAELVVAILLICGWLALILEVVVYLTNRESFKMEQDNNNHIRANNNNIRRRSQSSIRVTPYTNGEVEETESRDVLLQAEQSRD